MDIFDADAPRDGADPVTVEVQELKEAPGEAPRPDPTSWRVKEQPQSIGPRGLKARPPQTLPPSTGIMRPTAGYGTVPPWSMSSTTLVDEYDFGSFAVGVSENRPLDYMPQPDTADSAPQSTATVRAQARRGSYTHVDDAIGYRPMEGTQGVVADPALGFNWTAAPPRDVFATLADQPRTREPDDFDWSRESVRFPVETAQYARVNDNMGVRDFQYGDPPGPPDGSHTQTKWDCIGLAAMAATGTL